MPAASGVQGIGAAAAVVSPGTNVETVRWRGRYWHHGYRRGWGPGAAIGAGIVGLAAGAALAASAPPPAYYYDEPDSGDAVSYCMQRFRSYDPASGTYLGYDGLRHPCP